MILLSLLAFLIAGAFCVVVINNMELRKHNDELREHNQQLFIKNHRLEWDIEYVVTELRLTQVEYGIKNNPKQVRYGSHNVEKRKRIAH